MTPPTKFLRREPLTEFNGYTVWSFGMPAGGTCLQDWWDHGVQQLEKMRAQWEAIYRPTAYQSPQIRTLGLGL